GQINIGSIAVNHTIKTVALVDPGEVTPAAPVNLLAQGLDSNGASVAVSPRAFSWIPFNNEIATLDQAGLLTPKTPGNLSLKVQINGITYTLALAVSPAPGTEYYKPAALLFNSSQMNPTKITDFGSVVGHIGVQPAVMTSLTAAPTLLTPPAFTTQQVNPFAMNKNGAILAWYYTDQTHTSQGYVMWKSPSSAPIQVQATGTDGSLNRIIIDIAPDGTMYGTTQLTGDTQACYWTDENQTTATSLYILNKSRALAVSSTGLVLLASQTGSSTYVQVALTSPSASPVFVQNAQSNFPTNAFISSDNRIVESTDGYGERHVSYWSSPSATPVFYERLLGGEKPLTQGVNSRGESYGYSYRNGIDDIPLMFIGGKRRPLDTLVPAGSPTPVGHIIGLTDLGEVIIKADDGSGGFNFYRYTPKQ
ncbi:MAG: hypothetical protein ABUL49_01395, partial [bacterium]